MKKITMLLVVLAIFTAFTACFDDTKKQSSGKANITLKANEVAPALSQSIMKGVVTPITDRTPFDPDGIECLAFQDAPFMAAIRMNADGTFDAWRMLEGVKTDVYNPVIITATENVSFTSGTAVKRFDNASRIASDVGLGDVFAADYILVSFSGTLNVYGKKNGVGIGFSYQGTKPDGAFYVEEGYDLIHPAIPAPFSGYVGAGQSQNSAFVIYTSKVSAPVKIQAYDGEVYWGAGSENVTPDVRSELEALAKSCEYRVYGPDDVYHRASHSFIKMWGADILILPLETGDVVTDKISISVGAFASTSDAISIVLDMQKTVKYFVHYEGVDPTSGNPIGWDRLSTSIDIASTDIPFDMTLSFAEGVLL